MNNLNNIELMQQVRVKRLELIAFRLGRATVTMNNPIIRESVNKARNDNNDADVEYSLRDLIF